LRQALILAASFLCGLIYDFVWTRCVVAVSTKRALLAANLGAVLYVCTLLSTVMIVGKWVWAVVLYGVGNWLGVYLAVKSKK
jgi:hypothetical protein